MIKLLVLISVVSFAQAAFPFHLVDTINKNYFPWSYGSCLQYHNLENFQKDQFFRDHWYEQSSYGNYVFQADSVCSAVQSEIHGDEIRYLFYQYEPILKKYAYLRGLTKLTQNEASDFNLQFDFLAGLASIKVPYSVVATDYDNYAVFYSCQEALGFKAEMAWIVTRTRGDHSHDEEIKKEISKVGLNYDQFIPQKSSDCAPNEPYL